MLVHNLNNDLREGLGFSVLPAPFPSLNKNKCFGSLYPQSRRGTPRRWCHGQRPIIAVWITFTGEVVSTYHFKCLKVAHSH